MSGLDLLIAVAQVVGGVALFCYAAWHRWRMRGRPAKNWLDASYIGGAELLMLVGGVLLMVWPFLTLTPR